MKLRVILFLSVFLFVIEAQAASKPTVADAEQFMNQAEARLNDIEVKAARASWVQENFITDDTQALSADGQDQLTAATTELIEQAKRFDGLQLPPELARKFLLLRLSLTAPAPKDPALRKEMTQIGASLDADYGKGKYCRKPDDCLDITAIEKLWEKAAIPISSKISGWDGTKSAHLCASAMRGLFNFQIRARRNSDSKIQEHFGAQATICLLISSPQR